MITIKFPTKKKEGPEDISRFNQFSDLVGQLKAMGLKPEKFLGQISPFLYFHDENWHVIDHFGNYYGNPNLDYALWSDKTVTVLDFKDKINTGTEIGKIDAKTQWSSVIPGAQGMPKDLEELASGYYKLAKGFSNVGITTNLPELASGSKKFYMGPFCNPQALAVFEGADASFFLYIGCCDYWYSTHLISDKVYLRKVGPFSDGNQAWKHPTPQHKQFGVKLNQGPTPDYTYLTDRGWDPGKFNPIPHLELKILTEIGVETNLKLTPNEWFKLQDDSFIKHIIEKGYSPNDIGPNLVESA